MERGVNKLYPSQQDVRPVLSRRKGQCSRKGLLRYRCKCYNKLAFRFLQHAVAFSNTQLLSPAHSHFLQHTVTYSIMPGRPGTYNPLYPTNTVFRLARITVWYKCVCYLCSRTSVAWLWMGRSSTRIPAWLRPQCE